MDNDFHKSIGSWQMNQSELSIYNSILQNPGSTACNAPNAFYFAKNTIDPKRLADAILKVIGNHKSFCCNAGGDVSNPHMICNKRLLHRDIIPVKKVNENEITALLSAFVKPFDLHNDILFRVGMFETDSRYYVITDFSQLIFDGFSYKIFYKELNEAYCGKELEPEIVSLKQYNSEEQNYFLSDEHKKSAAFYDKMLSGLENKTDIEKECSVLSPEGVGTVFLELDPELSASVIEKNFSEKTFFASAYAYTSAKFVDMEESIIYTESNMRVSAELNNTVGMLDNIVPLYVKINEESGISDYILHFANLFENIQKKYYCPYTELAEKYGLTMDMLFAYQDDNYSNIVIDGTKCGWIYPSFDGTVTHIAVTVFKTENRFAMVCNYRADLYSRETIISFIKTYENIMKEFLCKKRLCDIELVSDEQKKILDSFNNREVAFDRSKSIIDLFREQVEKTPDNTAVVFRDRSYTYRETDEITERIAGYIKNLDIGREDVVSILIPRCEYMPIAAVGVLKAGAGYQPLDPSYPAERLKFMMEDSSAKLLIADENMLSLVPEYKGPVLLTKDIPKLPQCEKMSENPKPEDLFIMLYTSGTTGKPKGVMLEHGNLVSFCHWYHRYTKLESKDRVSAYASFGFDACMMDMYPALTKGAAIYIIPEDMRLDIAEINAYFEEKQITNAFFTTQVSRAYAVSMKNTSLKSVIGGGETLTPCEPPQNYKLINAYGPTECTILCSAFLVDKLYNRVPIGKPVDNNKFYVVDKQGRRLPAGALGELCIAGLHVGRGYLNRPELTAFCKNPFSDEKEYNRMYRTGDILRIMPDGNLDIIGRRDGQVKIRGFRIELSEVERIIREFDGVKDATVIAVDEPGGGKSIAAYVVGDKHIDIDAMNRFIKETKPAYMVPAFTMQIEKIPLNVNGKVDKRKLPKPVKKAVDIVLPKNDMQQKIYDCLKEIVGTDDFGITTDLFDIGLTSIGIIRVTGSILNQFGKAMTFADLLKNHTVEKIEEFLLNTSSAEAHNILSDYPITKTQYGIYVETMKLPDTTIYNLPKLIRLGDSVNIERLADAIKATCAAHPYINAIIKPNAKGEVRAYRQDNRAVNVQVVSTDNLPTDEDLVKPFNFSGDVLYRVAIYKTKSGNYLFCDFHHIIADGDSISVWYNDISRAYAGEKLDKEKYTGFELALDEEEKRKSDAYERAKEFYINIFSGCDTDFLPAQDEAEGKPVFANTVYKCKTGIKEVRAFAEKNGVTENAFYNAVMGYVLSVFNYRNDSIFATIHNGRDDPRLQNIIGMSVKTYPLLCKCEPEMSVHNYLNDVRKQILGHMMNDSFSFSDISEAFDLTADISFTYYGDRYELKSLCGEICSDRNLTLNALKNTISLYLSGKDDYAEISCDYRGDIYHESTIKSYMECFDEVAGEFLQKKTLGEIRLISKEREAIMDSCNDKVDVPFDENKTVVKVLREYAIQQPDTTAVVFREHRFTYKELNDLTDRIASFLIKNGVKKGTVVSVLIKRSENIVIAPFGVLKTGAAYQPLDPSYPAERLRFMMEDASADFVIADRDLLGCIPNYNGKVLFTDEFSSLSNSTVDLLQYEPQPHDLFMLLYTSGTTGKSKGVMYEHIGACLVTHNYATAVTGLKKGMSSICCASFGFDVCMLETFSAFDVGATLHIIDDDIKLNLSKLHEYVESNGIYCMFLTTQLGRLYVESFEHKSLKVMGMGGESLVPPQPHEGIEVYNGYGPTETSSTISHMPITKKYSLRVPIGKPIPNMKVYVVDKLLRRVPEGALGELCAASPIVARGYLNRPEIKSFCKNPFENSKFYSRMYRTGDIVRFMPDGIIDIVGRRDGMVKIRGFRIELSEVEKEVRRFPDVIDATVAAFDEPGGGKFLAAFVVSDKKLDVSAIKDFIGQNKPKYMVPAVIVQLDKIPLNINGKVDKKKLPKPQFSEERRVGREPNEGLEKTICGVFKDVLKADKVYADDSFFEIGGTSIAATKVVIKLNKYIPQMVYGDIFKYSTPQALAKFFEADKHNDYDEFDSDDYDYTAIDEMLKSNNIKSFRNGEMQAIGDIMLTGSTGYAGSHVLFEFLNNYDGKVYCPVRGNSDENAKERLAEILTFYFGKDITEDFCERVKVFAGDITDKSFIAKLLPENINTVINCAANVKHFSAGTDIEDTNYYGVLNLIEFCKESGARLVQTSTLSVMGDVKKELRSQYVLTEQKLYMGQVTGNNKYVGSKFAAERAVLAAASTGEINGKIVRLGNLAPRYNDGVFQINAASNAFMNSVKSVYLVGSYPYEALMESFDLSPIDKVAKAILLFAQTPKECTVFHGNNNNSFLLGNLYAEMNEIGMSVHPVEQDEYMRNFEEAKKDPRKIRALTGILAYAGDESMTEALYDNSYSAQILFRMGMRWPIPDYAYMQRFLKVLHDIKFFES